MTNPQSGDAALSIDGATRPLRLSLAALAEIETALGVDELPDLAVRLGRLSAQDLHVVLTALLRAGGAAHPETLAARADPVHTARAVAACFRANLS